MNGNTRFCFRVCRLNHLISKIFEKKCLKSTTRLWPQKVYGGSLGVLEYWEWETENSSYWIECTKFPINLLSPDEIEQKKLKFTIITKWHYRQVCLLYFIVGKFYLLAGGRVVPTLMYLKYWAIVIVYYLIYPVTRLPVRDDRSINNGNNDI